MHGSLVQELLKHLAVLAVGLHGGSSNLDREAVDIDDEPTELTAPGDKRAGVENSPAARAFVTLLDQMSGLERVAVVCTWASSPHDEMRLAAACALRSDVVLVGAATVLEALALDPSVDVRRAVVMAAHVRFSADPVRYGSILATLAFDSDPEVKDTAAALLRGRA